MKKYLLATAVAAVALASPASAEDGAPYVGIEAGILFPKAHDADISFAPFSESGDDDIYEDAIRFDFKRGIDADLIAGYDFGMFRLEAELGYKRASLGDVSVSDEFADVLEDEFGGPVDAEAEFDLDGRVKVLSGMANGLLDFGTGNANFTLGAGFGRAKVDIAGDSDSAWAWQLIAGVRTAITDNIDLGLKYRYFRTGRLNFFGNGEEAVYDDVDNTLYASFEDRFRSHSLMASLIFNLGARSAPVAPVSAPAPVVEPAAPAPATQTCADGSVILASDSCPPAPAATPERG